MPTPDRVNQAIAQAEAEQEARAEATDVIHESLPHAERTVNMAPYGRGLQMIAATAARKIAKQRGVDVEQEPESDVVTDEEATALVIYLCCEPDRTKLRDLARCGQPLVDAAYDFMDSLTDEEYVALVSEGSQKMERLESAVAMSDGGMGMPEPELGPVEGNAPTEPAG